MSVSGPPVGRVLRIGGLVAANGLATFALFETLLANPFATVLFGGVIVAAFLLAYRWRLVEDRWFLAAWVGSTAILSVYSLVAGPLNGLTDEAFVTPALPRLWPNLYGGGIALTYDQYGQTLTIPNDANVYLPLLGFLQIPGLSYKWVTLAAWAGTVYLLRRSGSAVTLWGNLWVGILAANGFNDLVPLFFLTLTIVTLSGLSSRLAEVVSLGLKQLANVVLVVYHLWNRRWLDAIVAVAITAAYLVPFAVLSPSGVWCHAVLLAPVGCGGTPGPSYGPGALGHFNYVLWPVWMFAVFLPRLARAPATSRTGRLVRAAARWVRPGADPGPAPPATPAVR